MLIQKSLTTGLCFCEAAFTVSVFFSLLEKVIKYCDEWGNWVRNSTGSTCQPTSKKKIEVLSEQLFLFNI